MAWTTIPNSALLLDKPWSSALAIAVRDNPIEIAKGSDGAPYVAAGWHPYDGVTVGDGNDGVIYDFAVSGTATSVTTPDFEDGYEYRLDFDGVVSAATELRVRLYRETSAAWSGTASVITGASAYNITGSLELRDPRRSLRACRVDASFYNASGGGTVASAWVNLTTAQKVLRAQVYPESPYNFSAGKIRMMRRRAF